MDKEIKKEIAPLPSVDADEEQSSNIINEIIPENDEKSNHIFKKMAKLLAKYPDKYPQNDIGASRLFYACYRKKVVYVLETKCWYIYNGEIWQKDEGNLKIMELIKEFVLNYVKIALNAGYDEEDKKESGIVKFANKLCSRSKRDAIIKDASSIFPMSFSNFDSKTYLFNCKNGTFNLKTGELQEHSPADYITKIANVSYDKNATCERWVQFVSEIMQNNKENEVFLQKCFGYAMSGDTNLECFFIFYGSTTRNGKSTTCETISYIFGDYATNAQAKTVAKNNRDGSSATPDIARLKGARFVTMAEPEKGLEIDVSLIKQLTGGDRYTGRFLNENPIEFTPEFKIFINTNHLPRVNDDTIFSSERVKILPFERHFNPEEQDTGLKQQFKMENMASGIFNWLIEGYNLLKTDGLDTPKAVIDATLAYREESDTMGMFLNEVTHEVIGAKVSTKILYDEYKEWAKDNGYHALNVKNFIAEMRKRYTIVRSGKRGNEIHDVDIIPKNLSWNF
ncbi:MAG: phage/plasmid primase, P4 family [Clostridia bacterium]